MRVYVYLECFCAGAWKLMRGTAPRADGSFVLFLRPEWQAKRYRAQLYGQNRANVLEPDGEATVG